jgi:ribose transport system substrate-binding protein
MKRSGVVRGLAALAAVAIIASACTSGATSAPASAAAASSATGASYKIGVSNTLQGNGWREEMICSIKAEALSSGRVSALTIDHRNTDAAGQLSDIRDLIAKGVNAIIVNPASPDAVNAALKEAIDKGITVVAIDQGVTQPGAYVMSNDQVNYGYLGAKWLFTQLKGTGNVIYMRGAAGASADTDRDTGFKKALAENPGIKVVKEVATGWDPAKGTQQINDILSSGIKFDGIWTSGIDNVIVDALKTAGHPFVPIVGADNAGFVKQLLTEPGPCRRRSDQPGFGRRRRPGAGLQDHGRQQAGRSGRACHAGRLGQRLRCRQGGPHGCQRSGDRCLVAARDHHPGPDHLYQGPDSGLQGTGRVASSWISDPQGDAGSPASPVRLERHD